MSEALTILFVLLVIVISPIILVLYHRDMKWGALRAVEIAQHQGWVSPHRLRTQAGFTNQDAQQILRNTCKKGVLFQAVDGRYYLPERKAKSTAPATTESEHTLRPSRRPDDSVRVSATIVRDTGMMIILDFADDRSGVYLEKRLMTDPVIDGNRITFGFKIKYLGSNRLHETLNRALAG